MAFYLQIGDWERERERESNHWDDSDTLTLSVGSLLKFALRVVEYPSEKVTKSDVNSSCKL